MSRCSRSLQLGTTGHLRWLATDGLLGSAWQLDPCRADRRRELSAQAQTKYPPGLCVIHLCCQPYARGD